MLVAVLLGLIARALVSRFLLSLHGSIQVGLLIAVGLRTVAVQDRPAALILSHPAELVVQITTCLVLVLLDGSPLVVQGIVAQILITKSSIVQRVIVLTTQVLAGKVGMLTVDGLGAATPA